MSSEGTPLHGDRGAWNVMDFDTEHGKDISDSTLRRHLPLPGAAGGIAQSDGTDWQRVNSLPLADLTDATRGCIIRRGATDWEAYDASTDGAALLGDGTDIISDLTPLWKGKHAFNNGFTFNANCDGSGTFDTNVECTLAGGDTGLQAFIYQADGTGMTGTLRGAYLTASGGNTANTGTIRGAEIKARAGRPGETGNDVAVLEGFSVSSDAKTYDVTTHRGGEIILDGGAGTSTLAVGLRIANNFQANRATTSYGLQIYRDSFDYTADIQLSHGHTIADGASAITFSTGLSVSGSITVSGDIDPTSGSGQDLGDAAHLWDVFASYVNVPSSGWVGCAADEERILFDSSGHDIYAYAPAFYIYAETNNNALLYIRSGGANKSSSIYLYEGSTNRWLFGYAATTDQFYFQQGGNNVVIFKDSLVANSLVLDPTAGHTITTPDNVADALHIVDAGALEYLKFVSTDAQPIIHFNDGGVDIDFEVEAVGVTDAFQILGASGQITLGALGAGAVQSSAGGVLSSGALPLTDLASYTQGDLVYGGAAGWQDLAHPGAANHVLQSTAAEVGWSANAVTFPAAGAVPVGSGANTQVAYWTAGDTLTGDAGLTYNAATDSLTIGAFINIGTNPATVGHIRVPNVAPLTARNAANTADINLLYLTAADLIDFGSGALTLDLAGNAVVTTSLAVGVTPATAGLIRIPNVQALTARNAANTGNVNLAYLTAADKLDLASGAVMIELPTAGGKVSIGAAIALAKLHVDQSIADAAIPVAIFDQADVSEEMMEFISTIGVGNAIEAVGGKTLTTTHFIKVTLPGALTRYIPVGTIA